MNEVQLMEMGRTGNARPAWWLVFSRELNSLWIGGRGLILILIFSVLLGAITYVMASNSELSLIPPKEMIFELLKIAVSFGGFITLIIGADMISGERERATLEWLLLTPASRRQMVIGKFLATISPWPVAMVITIPYLYLASQGDSEALLLSIRWTALLGSLLAIGLACLGMLISTFCNSNKTSYFISLAMFLVVLVPTQLPGTAQTGYMGRLFKKISPMESIYHFLEKTIVNNRTLEELQVFLRSPAIFAVASILLLIFLAGPRLRLEAGGEGKSGGVLGRFLGAFLLGSLFFAGNISRAHAVQNVEATPLTISMSIETIVVNAGDPILYETTITNTGSSTSTGVIVAMNIINLNSEGDVVDPEDWSPERTQYLESLGPGQSETLSWRINAILAGDYMVYTVAIPQPLSAESTSVPVTSSGMHLTVNAFTRINPLGVLPWVIGAPLILVAGIYLIFKLRRRALDDEVVGAKN